MQSATGLMVARNILSWNEKDIKREFESPGKYQPSTCCRSKQARERESPLEKGKSPPPWQGFSTNPLLHALDSVAGAGRCIRHCAQHRSRGIALLARERLEFQRNLPRPLRAATAALLQKYTQFATSSLPLPLILHMIRFAAATKRREQQDPNRNRVVS
jgi:hypothetical protein